MMLPFLTINDGMEIVYSDMRHGDTVKAYSEKPDVQASFHNKTYILPSYQWESIYGFS